MDEIIKNQRKATNVRDQAAQNHPKIIHKSAEPSLSLQSSNSTQLPSVKFGSVKPSQKKFISTILGGVRTNMDLVVFLARPARSPPLFFVSLVRS